MKLRRKLALIFGSLVALLLATAVGAIWALQGVLADLHHLDTEAWVVIEQANHLGTTISLVEVELYELELGRKRHLDALIEMVESMEKQVAAMEVSYVTHLPESAPVLEGIHRCLPQFKSSVAALATAQDPERAVRHRREAVAAAVGLRQDILGLSHSVRAHGDAEQAGLTTRFRWLVFGLTIVFLLVINASIIALLRMVGMVLRPVEQLVAATRELGRERFDYRVRIDQHDEFDELASAYNSLAGQLQTNEQRKVEAIWQVAATLSHELNNVAAIIELQCSLLSRQISGNPDAERHARQIHESLARMTRIVDSLKRVRRIVLTDYIAGVKMLDLEQSVRETPTVAASEEKGQGDLQRL